MRTRVATTFLYMSKEASTAIKVPILIAIICALCAEIVYKSDGGSSLSNDAYLCAHTLCDLTIATFSICASIGAGIGNVTCQKMDWIPIIPVCFLHIVV